jgi:hypothetical protein
MLCGLEGRSKFECPVHPLKHPFLDISQVAILGVQKPENAIAGLENPLKHRFLYLAEVASFRPE